MKKNSYRFFRSKVKEAEPKRNQPKHKHDYGYAYLVPYLQKDGSTHVLLGQKQVVSYEALRSIDRQDKKWESIKESLARGNYRIGFSKGRYYGLFLSAGGRPTFLGGSLARYNDRGKKIGYKNDSKQGAIDEFFEEIGSIKDQLTKHREWIKENLEQLYTTDWGGIYYALDVSKNDEVSKILSEGAMKEENARIGFLQAAVEKMPSEERKEKNIYEQLTEMRELRWVKSNELELFLSWVPEEYLVEQVTHCSKEFIFNNLGVSNDKVLGELIKFVKNEIENAPLNDNVEVAKKLLNLISGEVANKMSALSIS